MKPPARDLGIWRGVMAPALVVILGALPWLREGWLVGNAGLLGALAIIALAHLVTGTTALSLASFASNLRRHPGGVFDTIAQALGVEAAGAIGIPLYFAWSAVTALYLFAFAEVWTHIWPHHDGRLVVVAAFASVATVAFLAARASRLAAAARTVVLALTALALIAAFVTAAGADLHGPRLLGTLRAGSFVESFALFFPGATGLMAGVVWSGRLADPRRVIPRGTLGAWVVGLLVYGSLALWYATVVRPADLLTNPLALADRSLVRPLALTALLGAGAAAALSTLLAAPRLLHAMAEQRVVPLGAHLARTNRRGDPVTAMVVTQALVATSLLAGSLDAIAPVVTTLFLGTYFAVNLVVFLEQRLHMVSFRPSFAVPRVVPALGTLVCLTCLAWTARGFGFVEMAAIAGIFVWLVRRRVATPWQTVRSGIAVNLADWAARRTALLDRGERAWKPDLLVPVDDVAEARAMLPLLTGITHVAGSVKLVGLRRDPDVLAGLPAVGQELRRRGIWCTWTCLDAPGFAAGTRLALDALQGGYFPPNLVLVDVSRRSDEEVQEVVDHCRDRGLGVVLHLPAEKRARPVGDRAAVWLSDRSPDWALRLHLANLDLPVLLGWLLADASGGNMRLHTVVREPASAAAAHAFLLGLADGARLPETTRAEVAVGRFDDVLRDAPPAVFHVFGLPLPVSGARLREIRDLAAGPCLFVRDSGRESALA